MVALDIACRRITTTTAVFNILYVLKLSLFVRKKMIKYVIKVYCSVSKKYKTSN